MTHQLDTDIAGQALASGLILVTNNTQEFRIKPGIMAVTVARATRLPHTAKAKVEQLFRG